MPAGGVEAFETVLESCQQRTKRRDLRCSLCQLACHFLLERGFVDAADTALPDDLPARALRARDVLLAGPRDERAERFVETGVQIAAQSGVVEYDEIRRSAVG